MPNGMENQIYQGASNLTGQASSSPQNISWAGLLGIMVVFLIILVVSLWLIKRLNHFSVRNIQAPWVRVLDRQVLQGQQTLFLIEIAGKIQVLGGTDHHLTKVAEINDPDVVAEILEEIALQPQQKMDWFLNGIWKKFQRKTKGNTFPAELERLLEEVRK